VNSFKEPGRALFANWSVNLDEIPLEQLDHYIAVENYLMDDEEPPLDVSNLEKVRDYLKSFHHLCEVEDWQRARAVICCQLDTPTQEKLHHQLGTWGYYQERIDLYSRLLYKLNPYWDSICLNGLGDAYDSLGEYVRAIEYHQQDLAIAQEIGDKAGEETALGSLGIAYHALGDYTYAVEYHQRSLVIAQEIGNKAGEGKAIGNLGIAYHALGDYVRALEYHQQRLAIAQEIDDKKARRVAQQIGLKVIGTVGMLLRAKNQGVITEIKPLLTELVQVDFRITNAIIQEALRLSGEDSPLTSD
jgi:tetratricopeptide (TPR) repeat protein